MKKLLLATAAVLAITPALAADLPKPYYKAADFALAPAACTPTSCTGVLVGFNVEGIGTSFDVLGQGLNGSVNSAGLGIGGQFGYQYWDGTYLLAGRGIVDYVTVPPSVPGGQNTGYWHGMAIASLGYNLLGKPATPPVPPATFPQSLLNMLTSPYLNLGVSKRSDSNSGTVTGAGLQYVVAPDATLNVDYFHISYSNGGSLAPGVAAPVDNRVMLSFNKMFKS